MAQKQGSSQHGARRNLQDLEGFHAFYVSNCRLRFLAKPLTVHRRLAGPAPGTARLALLEAPCRHGEWCLLTEEVRPPWLSVDSPLGAGACKWRQGSTPGAKAQDLPLSR